MPAGADAVRGPTPGIGRLLVATAAILFAVSGGVLWDFGYNYDGLQGSAATKIHPSTYLLFGLLAWRTVQSGRPVDFVKDRVARRPAASWLLTLSLLLLVTTALRGGPGLAGFIDTFGAPAVLALLLIDYESADLKALTLTLHFIMAVNALLGLGEFASSTLLFPYRFDGVVHLEDTRSTALQGHPLSNAALTGVYVVSLMGGAKSLRPALKLGLILLQFMALVVFGGRTAIVVTMALTPLYGLYAIYATLRRGRMSLLAAAGVTAAVPLLVLAVIAVIEFGFADRLMMRFVDDSGSAQSRVTMFEMLDQFTWFELLVGPDIEMVEFFRGHFGLEQGVENPFIRMTLYQGGYAMALVFLSLAWFFRELLKGRGFAVFGSVFAMAVLLNSSESISVKTDYLVKLVLIFVVLFPRAPPRLRPRASVWARSSARSRSRHELPLRGTVRVRHPFKETPRKVPCILSQ
jgi:hypothetical protein